MTEPNEVDRILGEMLNTGTPGTFTPNEYGKKKIAQAKQALLAEILKKRPPDQKGVIAILDKEGKRYYKQEDLPKGAYNEALSAYDKEIERMLK